MEAKGGTELQFEELRKRVGFDDYYETSSKYETSKR